MEKGFRIKKIGKVRNDRLETIQLGSSRKVDLALGHYQEGHVERGD